MPKLMWAVRPGPWNEPIRIATSASSGQDERREVYRVVPHSRRSWRLEKRDGAFWWPLLGVRRSRHGVPLPRTWRSPDAAMRDAAHLGWQASPERRRHDAPRPHAVGAMCAASVGPTTRAVVHMRMAGACSAPGL